MMRRSLGILLIGLMTVAAFMPLASAEEAQNRTETGIAKKTEPEAPLSADGFAFAPQGLARDVVNLMNGIRKPLDESTSLTIQAGKSLRIGLSF